MDDRTIRAWWWSRQGLDGSLKDKSPAEVLQRSGWARSVGGAGPYLTLHARAGTTREAADTAVAKLDIHELPSARGCTYVVPASDFALALKVGEGFNSDMKTALKLGVTEKEIGKLGDAILKALAKAPHDPDELRQAVGGAVRSLGPGGIKKGMASTLPLALGKLQTTGDIRRIPTNGRLDQQRYRYTTWRSNPLAKFKLSADQAFTELARRFFRWIGPATVADFQGFAGLGVKASKAAVDALKLAPLGDGGDRLMFADDLDALQRFKPPKQPQYALVSGLDALFLLRRNVQDTLDKKDRDRQVLDEKGIVAAGGIKDLPNHAIVDRGRLVGLWEYDPATESIAWSAFVKDKALNAAVKATEKYVREQLGDARSFSLDSPKSRMPRIEALRAAAR